LIASTFSRFDPTPILLTATFRPPRAGLGSRLPMPRDGPRYRPGIERRPDLGPAEPFRVRPAQAGQAPQTRLPCATGGRPRLVYDRRLSTCQRANPARGGRWSNAPKGC